MQSHRRNWNQIKEMQAFKESLQNVKLEAGFGLAPGPLCVLCDSSALIRPDSSCSSISVFKANPAAAFAIYQWEIKEKGGKVRKTHHHVQGLGMMGVKKGWRVSLSNETQSLPGM